MIKKVILMGDCFIGKLYIGYYVGLLCNWVVL